MAAAEEVLRRLTSAETNVTQLAASLTEHREELVANNNRYGKLMADLQASFTATNSELVALRQDHEELKRDAIAAGILRAGAGGGAGLRLVDTRIMDKPTKFFGENSEWKEWSESFVAFCSAADEALGKSLEKYSKLPDPILMSDMSPEERQHSRQLHYMLVMLAKKKAAGMRRSICDKGSGLEAWRVFANEFEPQVQNRYGGLLGQILTQKFQGTGVEEFNSWSTKIREYEEQK